MKLLLVIDKLSIGGIASSLYSFLHFIPNDVSCDLLVFDQSTIDFTRIPKGITLCDDVGLDILGKSIRRLSEESKLKMLKKAALSMVARLTNGIVARKILFHRCELNTEYDLAIAYAHDTGWHSLSTGCCQFVAEVVKAKYKAAYIHCDYKHFGGNDKRQITQFQAMDSILCVSESVRNRFIDCFPTLNDKVSVLENFIVEDAIVNQCNEYHKYPMETVNFVTVCRLTEEKGLLRCLNAFGRLNKEGISNFTWTVVGDGPLRETLVNKLDELGMQKFVQLVGATTNPYYYMKNASYFILPSFHEAAPIVFGECAVLKLPIISTETASAKELVENRGLGIVCSNSEDGIHDAIQDVLTGNVSDEFYKPQVNLNVNAVKQLDCLLQKADSKGKK